MDWTLVSTKDLTIAHEMCVCEHTCTRVCVHMGREKIGKPKQMVVSVQANLEISEAKRKLPRSDL